MTAESDHADVFRRGYFAVPVARDAVAVNWRARGYDCHDFSDPPGRAWRDFVHDVDEVVTVLSGRLALEMDDVALELGPGDEAFIPRGARHTVRSIAEGRTDWLFGYGPR